MKQNLIRYAGIFASVLLFFTLLTACGGGDGENREGGIDNTIIESYLYLPESLHMTHVTGLVHSTIVHEGQLYICYVIESAKDSDPPIIVVERMLPDGTQVSQTEIPVSFDHVDVAALHITEAGNLAFILTGITWTEQGRSSTILYLEYTQQGAEIMRRDLTELIPQLSDLSHIGQAMITDDGDILLLASADMDAFVYLLDRQFSLRGQMEVSFGQRMSQLRDGRVVISDLETNENTSHTVLREVDFAAGGWGETHPISVADIRSLYPARADDSFDLYIDDGVSLFGYIIGTGDRTMMLNWVEARVGFGFRSHLNFLEDGRLSLLISHGDFTTEHWRTEHVRLTRTPRADLPDYTVITLGVERVGDGTGLRERVAAFNREHRDYQIQLVEYWDGSWEAEDWEATRQRFATDLITGNAPDIILVPHDMRDALIRQDLLADLYPLIDADPVLNRSDFFPNVLAAMEAPDGSLPAISDSFMVETIIGMADAVGNIQSWTFADMRTLIEQTGDTPFILGEWTTAERFLDLALQFSGDDFINWPENSANLDSEEFIQLLEISTRLPHVMAPWDFGSDGRIGENVSPVIRMLHGEQLLDLIHLRQPCDWQMFTGMLGNDIVALGLPTADGGAHLIHMFEGFAISANSPFQEAAWRFIRQFLLPDINLDHMWDFPLRIDLFDAVIADAKTPRMELDEDGNEVETWRGGQGMGDFLFYFYAMSEEEEHGLRAIVESARILAHFDETVTEMVREETLPFFAGDRSAADTARILQNRVQTFLNERR